jgi:hypothetical protein
MPFFIKSSAGIENDPSKNCKGKAIACLIGVTLIAKVLSLICFHAWDNI